MNQEKNTAAHHKRYAGRDHNAKPGKHGKEFFSKQVSIPSLNFLNTLTTYQPQN